MKIDISDSRNHNKPLWVVYGYQAFPSILCCIIKNQPDLTIWGYSEYRNSPSFRTLGYNIFDWMSNNQCAFHEFYDDHGEAIARISELTKPSQTAINKLITQRINMTKMMVVDLMQKWVFVPIVSETGAGQYNIRQPDGQVKLQEPTVVCDQAFIEEYQKIENRFFELQLQLENAYSQQQGMDPKT